MACGVRAAVELLACAPTGEALLDAVAALPLGPDADADADADAESASGYAFAVHSEKVGGGGNPESHRAPFFHRRLAEVIPGRHVPWLEHPGVHPSEMPRRGPPVPVARPLPLRRSRQLQVQRRGVAALAEDPEPVVASLVESLEESWVGSGLRVGATSAPPADSPPRARPPSRARRHFVLLQAPRGWALGHVLFSASAPSGWDALDFRDAPHTWCAGLPPTLAAAAVNCVASPGDSLLDPCCGSGTIVFEAQRRGIRAVGRDVLASSVAMAVGNLAWARGAGGGGGGGSSRSSSPNFDPSAVEGADARSLAREGPLAALDAVVANLPYDRALKYHRSSKDADNVRGILANLRSLAPRHAFFGGEPLEPLLRECGYEVRAEACVCRKGKRFLALCGPLPDVSASRSIYNN